MKLGPSIEIKKIPQPRKSSQDQIFFENITLGALADQTKAQTILFDNVKAADCAGTRLRKFVKGGGFKVTIAVRTTTVYVYASKP